LTTPIFDLSKRSPEHPLKSILSQSYYIDVFLDFGKPRFCFWMRACSINTQGSYSNSLMFIVGGEEHKSFNYAAIEGLKKAI